MDVNEFAAQQAKQLVQIPDLFLSGVERAQNEIYNRILELYSTLDRDGDDIVMSDENLAIAEEIKNSLQGIFDDSKYENEVTKFVKQFDMQKELIDAYLVANFGEQVTSEFADSVFEATKRNAVEQLASSTVKTNFLRPLEGQINLAVQTGQSFRETVRQLRSFATGGKIDPGVPLAGRHLPGGKLLQYSKQIAYDSIAMSDRAYTNAVASDVLDSEWYFYAGGVLPTSRDFCLERVGKYYHYKEIESWADEQWQGKPENLNKDNIYVLLGGYNCQHTLIPVSIDQVPSDVIQRAIDKGFYDPTKKEQKIIDDKIENEPAPDELNEDQQKEFDSFERDATLKGDDAKIQDDSIKYFIKNKDDLVIQYLKDNGNVANTDEARKLFDVVGYNGKNAPAVHEASAALNKLVQQRLIDTGKMNHVVMYAGGAGSGKTSAIEGLFKSVKNSADVIIDGNMAGMGKAAKLVDNILSKGKTAEIMYVYRDPVDAWTNGVIKRMIENKAERGRIVPLRVFLDNTTGSYNTIKGLLELDKYRQVNINLIDNSLGRGNTRMMDLDKFHSIRYDENQLKRKLIDETRRLVESGRITKEQFEALTEMKY